MLRSRRRRLDRYAEVLSELKPRFIGGTLVPGELAVLVPDCVPICYVNERALLHDLALDYLESEASVSHVVFSLDILGGLHEVRVHAGDEHLTLEQVAHLHSDVLREFPLPTTVVYAERTDTPRHIGPARWEQLQRAHPQPVFVTDVLVVSPNDRIVWSAAEQYGPDPFEPELAEARSIPVQAARIRERLGLPDSPHAA